ncbi:interleukin-12 subunit beta isoform X2 [Mixophyes fleayi]|uniref:interleukin-12 subunit beta isoform X2 n=1 Tax=Mixophyes fleayi TaxID=3061075 RepID=UPI003F4D9E40
MPVLAPIVIILILCVHPLQGAWELPIKDKTLVVDMSSKDASETVKIECNAADHQSVRWDRRPDKHKTISITVTETADGGKFTCKTADGNVLDYKVVLLNLLHLPVFKRILPYARQPITCKVKNYSGHFSCSWSATVSNPEFIFEAHRGNHSITCHKPVREDSVYTVHCHDTQSCQYAEEVHNITIVLHAIHQKKYENHTLSFAMREILKPDPPQELVLNKTKHHKHVSLHWKYPKTWCSVHSFFPLIFNIKITKDNQDLLEHRENVEETDLVLYHKGISSFCVQARDKYFNSSWSEWSCYKLEKKSKNKKQKRKKKKEQKS